MPTPSEKKALLFFAAAILLGSGVRVARSFSTLPDVQRTSQHALAGQIASVEAARARGGKAARPASTERVDVDRATAAQLQTLPRVGPVLARRIVGYRDSAGPFGSLEVLDRVKGIGPALLRELAPRVTFSGSRRP